MTSRLDAFGSFLETLHEDDSPRQSSFSDVTWQILAVLGNHGGSMLVADVLRDTSTKKVTLAEALVGLDGAGLVDLEESERGETVHLTPAGQKAARVIKSLDPP
jgi:DNA-binding MarR family transcriptional regulator